MAEKMVETTMKIPEKIIPAKSAKFFFFPWVVLYEM